MRVVRAAGQNVSPSDDGRLYDQIFSDGLFTDTTFTNLGGNGVQVGAIYGDLCGRDFTIEQMTLAVTLPEGEGEVTGYIYVEIDTSSDDVISLNSTLAPFTPTYEDINTNGAIAQMILAEYTATAVAVTSVTPVFNKAAAGAVKAGSIATVESAQATQNHSVGEYILLNNQLYIVTAAVTTGETFIEGTNITAAVIGDALSELKSGLTNVQYLANNVIAGTVTMQVSGTSRLLVRQCGHIVAIWGYIDGLSLTTNTEKVVAKLSGVSLPADNVRVRGAVGNAAYVVGSDAYIVIAPNGNIAVNPAASGSTIYFNATYIR